MTDEYNNHNPYHKPDTAFGEDRTWSVIAHGVPLAVMWLSAGILGFVASIVIFMFAKNKSPFIRNYSAQALNIQLNALIWFIISWVLLLVLIGVIMLPLIAVVVTIMHVVAMLKASQGQIWKPPFCIQFVSAR